MTTPLQPDQPFTLDQMTPTAQPPRRRTLPIVVAALAAVALIGLGAAVATVALTGGTSISDAQTTCDADGGASRVSDGGKTLAIEARESWDVQTLRCVLGELGAPDAVMEEMSATRALDGRQEAEWGDYSASWTYHPDQGLRLIITTT